MWIICYYKQNPCGTVSQIFYRNLVAVVALCTLSSLHPVGVIHFLFIYISIGNELELNDKKKE